MIELTTCLSILKEEPIMAMHSSTTDPLVSPTQVTSNVSVLELFAALGGIGWLGRHIFKLQ